VRADLAVSWCNQLTPTLSVNSIGIIGIS